MCIAVSPWRQDPHGMSETVNVPFTMEREINMSLPHVLLSLPHSFTSPHSNSLNVTLPIFRTSCYNTTVIRIPYPYLLLLALALEDEVRRRQVDRACELVLINDNLILKSFIKSHHRLRPPLRGFIETTSAGD